MVAIDWNSLYEAYMVSSAGDGYDCGAHVCRATGKTFVRFADMDETLEEETPDDLDDQEKYLPLPTKRDLDLGKRLVLKFARERLPEDLDDVRDIFSRSGAYARFKDFLHRRGALDDWRDYENAAEERALREWCAENGVEITPA